MTNPLGILLSEYPRKLELHWQSQDYPNAGVTPDVPELSQDHQTQGSLCQSIPKRRSYTGNPGIIQGSPTPLRPLCQSIPEHRSYNGSPKVTTQPLGTPLSEYPRMAVTSAVSGLSRDYLTPWDPVPEYPQTPELHRQSMNYSGVTKPWDTSVRVSLNFGVTGIIQGSPTPLNPSVRMLEVHQQSQN